MVIDEGNIMDHTLSMDSRPPDSQIKMELTHEWVNKPNINPTLLNE